jgi:SAM-dependent methyltransferase
MNRRIWLTAAVGAGIGLNTARLRHRLSALAVAEPSDDPVDPGHVFVLSAGATLDEAQRRAASAHARRHGLDVLDLVPEELSPDRLLDLARGVDTTNYQASRLRLGRGAYHAMLVDRAVLARAGLPPAQDATEADLVELILVLKRYAPVTTGLVVLPGLRAPARSGAGRFEVRRAAYAWEPTSLAAPLVRDALLAAGATAAPRWSLAVAALSWLQPAIVAAGGPLRVQREELLAAPLVRRRGAAALAADVARLPTGPAGRAALAERWRVHWPRTWGSDDPARLAKARADYQADIAAGVERFLEPRRETCPWCGSARLRRMVVGVDAMQVKPGRFRYDRCGECRHVFQNPRLSPEGLDFYYRDFYDGLGGPAMELLLGAGPGAHPDRARSVPARPRRWLDVGTGMGHFCLLARDVWPDTVFDGLDMGEGIDEAERRGWVDRAHRGQFPEIAPTLAGQYDVVSMFHYLEHTRDPRAELDAAVTALQPGGYLLIEVPNPDSPALNAYGALASGMLIPQHLNLVTAPNLVTAVEERGLRVENLTFGRTHISGDAPMAWWGLAQRLGPSPSLPWRADQYPLLGHARRAAALTALAPLLPAAALAEAVSRPYLVRGDRANAYRLVARLP